MRSRDKKVVITGALCMMFAILGHFAPNLLTKLNIAGLVVCVVILAARNFKRFK